MRTSSRLKSDGTTNLSGILHKLAAGFDTKSSYLNKIDSSTTSINDVRREDSTRHRQCRREFFHLKAATCYTFIKGERTRRKSERRRRGRVDVCLVVRVGNKGHADLRALQEDQVRLEVFRKCKVVGVVMDSDITHNKGVCHEGNHAVSLFIRVICG